MPAKKKKETKKKENKAGVTYSLDPAISVQVEDFAGKLDRSASYVAESLLQYALEHTTPQSLLKYKLDKNNG